MQYCTLHHDIAEESVAALLGELGDQFDLFDCVQDAETVSIHSGAASRMTASAKRGFSPRLETTSTLQPSTVSRSSHMPVKSSNERPGSKSTRKSISEFPAGPLSRRIRRHEHCGRHASRQWRGSLHGSGHEAPLVSWFLDFEYAIGRILPPVPDTRPHPATRRSRE
jgi:hypothetical protein